ncbi:hypothetical protein AWB80_02616 [Caballeronia pedi]|uniref:Uncharacterized protein n=1 Tax=Caballeronia pedi TaxID=1777141 RepID=A0A158ASV8_9BURK|nr:hypothetical protein AWB80_02616 [Caballeronia pedi]
MTLQLQFTEFACWTSTGRDDVRIELRAQDGDLGGAQASFRRKRRNQSANFRAGPGLNSLRVALSNQRVDFVGLGAHLRLEAIGAAAGSAKLLNKIEFFLTCLASARLIRGGHAPQGVEFDQHRMNAPLGFLDGVLDLLGVVLGVVAQLVLQFVDMVAKSCRRLSLLLQALRQRLVFLFPASDHFTQAGLRVRSLRSQGLQLGLECRDFRRAGFGTSLRALVRLLDCLATGVGIADLSVCGLNGGVEARLFVVQGRTRMLLGFVIQCRQKLAGAFLQGFRHRASVDAYTHGGTQASPERFDVAGNVARAAGLG